MIGFMVKYLESPVDLLQQQGDLQILTYIRVEDGEGGYLRIQGALLRILREKYEGRYPGGHLVGKKSCEGLRIQQHPFIGDQEGQRAVRFL